MRKLTHEEFLNKIKENNDNFKNGNLTLASEYSGTDKPITIECAFCGKKWNTNRAVYLLNKSYHCKFCNYNRKFTPQEFESKLKEINPDFRCGNFILTSTYLGLGKPITIKCTECNREWTVEKATYLLTETFHCNACHHGNRLTQDEFLNRLKKINSNFKENKLILISKYMGMNKPITVRCTSCGSEWTVQAKALLREFDCKFCSSKKT